MHAAVEDIAHHLADMLDVISVFQRRMAHARPGGEPHFLFLDMEGGFEILQPAGVVVMHMGDDDIVDLAGVEPNWFNTSAGRRWSLTPRSPSGCRNRCRRHNSASLLRITQTK